MPGFTYRHMMFSNLEIEEFMNLYRHEYGKEIDFELAREEANKLLNLFASVYTPIPTIKINLLNRKEDKNE